MTPRPLRRTAAALVLLVLAAFPAPVIAQAAPTPRTAAILILRGNDTLVVERVRRTATSVTATVAVMQQPQMDFEFALGPAHTIRQLTFAVRGVNAPVDATPLQAGTLTITGDSAFLDIRSTGGTRALRIGTRAGALPIVNNDFVVLEQAVRQARAQEVRSLTVPLFTMSGAATIEGRLDLLGADSARFTIGNNVTVVSIDADGNVTGGALPAQGMRIVVVVGPEANAVSLGRPDYAAPAGAPYTAEEVVVRTPAGHQLSGTLTRPSGATGRVPAVVTITGSGAQDRDEYISLIPGGWRLFRQLADTLGRRGIAVLRLDDRGVGGSGGDVNGTSADFADDIRAAVAYLRTRTDIDPARVALVGHSEGGMIAPMVARTDAQLAGLVLMAGPAYTGRQIIDYQIRNVIMGDTSIPAAQRDSIVSANRAQFDSTSAKLPWMRYFLDYDPIPTARAVRQPVLIAQGATDQQVRAEEASLLEAAFRAGGNRNVTTRIFADRNHLFLRDPVGHPSGYARLTQNKVDAEVLGAIADWLAVTLRAP